MATREHHEHHEIVEAVYTVVTGEPEHLDQYPYIDSWLGLAEDPPTWTRFCIQKGNNNGTKID